MSEFEISENTNGDQKTSTPHQRFWLGTITVVCSTLLRRLFKLFVWLYFAFILLILVLRYCIFPYASEYKPWVEQNLSQQLGGKVEIASLEASWQGLHPRFVLKDFKIFDADGKASLHLPLLDARLSWISVPLLTPRFDQIYLNQPELLIQRRVDGQIVIAGLQLKSSDSKANPGLDWLLSQHHVLIDHAKLQWQDQFRKSPELRLNEVSLRLRNKWHSHQLSVTVSPPKELAAPFVFRADFRHPVLSQHPSDFASWTGEAFVDLNQANIPSISTWVDLPMEIKSANGFLRAWLKFDKKESVELVADLKVTDVFGQFRKDLPVLEMNSINGRIIVRKQDGLGKRYLPSFFGASGHSVALVGFTMEAKDGSRLPSTTIEETFTPGENGKPEQVEIKTAYLDLGGLANFFEHLPIPSDQRQMLADLEPRGQLKNFTAKWRGRYPDIASYNVVGTFENFTLNPRSAQLARPKIGNKAARAAVPAIPGVENISGSVEANEKGGKFTLNSQNLVLKLPEFFVEPRMPFEKLEMQARWEFLPQDRIWFQVDQMQAQQESMRFSITGSHKTSLRGAAAGANEVDISGKLTGFNLNRLNRFLPLQTEPNLRHWLLSSIQGGSADDVVLRLKGDLNRFPFSTAERRDAVAGEFLVKGKLSKAHLDFAAGELNSEGKPLWPHITEIDGSFAFERSKMEILVEKGKTLSAEVKKVKATIPDLNHANAILQIDGQALGSMQSLIHYANSSPVATWTDHILKDTKATGNGALNLKLTLPLNHIVDAKVVGSLVFSNNDVQLLTELPLLTAVTGKLDFNEHGIGLNNLKVGFLGGAASLNGGSQKDGSIRIKADGLLTSEGISKALASSLSPSVLNRTSGATRYSANINVKNAGLEISVESGLQGLALNFPAPLQKASADILPIKFELTPLPASGSLSKDELSIRIGSIGSAKYQRQKVLGGTWQLIKGGIGIGAPIPEADTGVVARIELNSLNLDEWNAVFSDKASITPIDARAASASTESDSTNYAAYFKPTFLALNAKHLQLFDKPFENITLGLTKSGLQWQLNFDSEQASGHVALSENKIDGSTDTIVARLNKLIIPRSAANDVTEILEAKNSHYQIPNLDIVADQFELFGKKLGKLELQAQNQYTTQGREWLIRHLKVKNADAELKATGRWSSNLTQNSTSVKYTLEIENAGRLVDRLGWKLLTDGKGKMEGQLAWSGVPFSPDIASLEGQVQLNLSSGQIVDADPGVTKVFSVFGLQSLFHKLRFDFRDVTTQGFAFDTFAGSATMKSGLITTDSTKIVGVNASILIEGELDLKRSWLQNTRIVYVPVIDFRGGSLLYGFINPVLGIGTFLTNVFLKDPLAKAATKEFKLSGPISNPIIEDITSTDNASQKQNK